MIRDQKLKVRSLTKETNDHKLEARTTRDSRSEIRDQKLKIKELEIRDTKTETRN